MVEGKKLKENYDRSITLSLEERSTIMALVSLHKGNGESIYDRIFDKMHLTEQEFEKKQLEKELEP